MLPVANPKVIYKPLSDGAVLFSTEDEVYFGLNTVGARVWALLPPATNTMEEMCTTIAAEYPDVDPDVVRADVTELLAELSAHRLVLAGRPGQDDGQGVEGARREAGETASARVG